MRFMASFCRKQEAIQQDIAENDPLESRRKIAAVAAAAWKVKSKEAEEREADASTPAYMSPQDKLDAKIRLEFAREDAEEALAGDRLD